MKNMTKYNEFDKKEAEVALCMKDKNGITRFGEDFDDLTYEWM